MKPQRFIPRVLPYLFTLGVLISACAPSTRKGPQHPARGQTSQDKVTRNRAQLELPAPLPVPRSVPARVFLRNPGQIEKTARVALQDPNWSIRGELRSLLSTALNPQAAQRVAAVCDIHAPWHFLALRGGVEILSASVQPDRSAALKHWLESLPAAGNFGARQIKGTGQDGRSQGWMIWTGPEQSQILLAPSLRGLVTALNLRGLSTPLHAEVITAGLTPARRNQLEIPRGLLELHAKGELKKLVVDLKVDDARAQEIAKLPVRPGPIPDLLRDPTLVWAGSSTWTEAQTQVRRSLAKVRSQVADLPFLVRPTAENLEQRLIRSVKQWDGRSAVALDQRQSLRVALGVKSVGASELATLGLIQATIPNLQLMRSFSTDVPSARLVQQRARSNGLKIHELILSDISGQLPAELHGLLSRRRRLHVAMAWSPSAKALLLCIGPEAVPSMLSWIQSSRTAAPVFDQARTPVLMQAKSTVAASVLLNWLEDQSQALPSLAQLLRLRAATPRQDYAVSMTPVARDLIHMDLRLDVDTPERNDL